MTWIWFELWFLKKSSLLEYWQDIEKGDNQNVPDHLIPMAKYSQFFISPWCQEKIKNTMNNYNKLFIINNADNKCVVSSYIISNDDKESDQYPRFIFIFFT